MKPMISVVTLINDEAQYKISKASLCAQLPKEQLELLPIRPDAEGLNAAGALNLGLSRANADWVVCAHQDVIFPVSWWSRVESQLKKCPKTPDVAGLVGVTRDGFFRGHVLDTHGHCRWLPLPSEVLTLDEHLVLLRRKSGLRFDTNLEGFHCYVADLCLQAAAAGSSVYAIDAPVIHLSRGKLDDSFSDSADWLLEKWGKPNDWIIPLAAAVVQSKDRVSLIRRWRIRMNRRSSGRARQCACDDFRQPLHSSD